MLPSFRGSRKKRTDSRRLFSGSTIADSISRPLRFRRAVTSGRRRNLCIAGRGGVEERAWTSASAASAMRMRREFISSSAVVVMS